MLLNNEIKITVTNNGENNNVSLSFNNKDKFSDVMTCLQMASNTLRDTLGECIKNKGDVTDKELYKILKTITLEDIYERENI
jgi:ABC-type transport system involved in cytochrome bd biosynthesis fused ATPase/permease subunit